VFARRGGVERTGGKVDVLDHGGKCMCDNWMGAETLNMFLVRGYLLEEYVDMDESGAFERGRCWRCRGG
jgi:hypothetical protein